jgi:hypothetical protein
MPRLLPSDFNDAAELLRCVKPQSVMGHIPPVELLLAQQNVLLNRVLDSMERLTNAQQLGSQDIQIKDFLFADAGQPKQILAADRLARPRKVLIILPPRVDEDAVSVSIRPEASVGPEVGPKFAAGTTHDFGVVPGKLELYGAAAKIDGTSLATSPLRLWVMAFY